jgi:hypothetical protein
VQSVPKHGTRRQFARIAATILAVVALTAGAVQPSTAQTSSMALRNFDTVTTAAESGGWKHLATIGDQYMIFNDGGVFEGPAFIRNKWPFLPARFTANLDAASVVLEGRRWKYMFVQDNERVVFFDSGIADGPQSYPGKWPFLSGGALGNGLDAVSAHMPGRQWIHYATKGQHYATFTDNGPTAGVGLIRDRWNFLPERFMSDLDDVSVEQEEVIIGGFRFTRDKISFYKGDERLIFGGSAVEEIVTLSSKWPFLNAWRTF